MSSLSSSKNSNKNSNPSSNISIKSTIDYNNNLDRTNNLSIDSFNTILEDNKPYTKEYFKDITKSNTIKLGFKYLIYIKEFNIIICSRCNTTILPTIKYIIVHFRVSFII